MTSPTLEALARQALEGDRDALDSLLRSLQGDLYGLALRMLWNREDAEDATQEILVRIVTRLSQFNFESRVKTWAYRVAVNYILDTKKNAVERLHVGFERFAENLEAGLAAGECWRRRAVAADRRGQGRLQPRDAAVSRSSAPPRLCARRHHGAVGARGRRGARDQSGAVPQAVAARTGAGSRVPARALRPRLRRGRLPVQSARSCLGGQGPGRCPARSTSRGAPPRSRRRARWFARWRKRGGRSRCIAAASRAPRRSTSPSSC